MRLDVSLQQKLQLQLKLAPQIIQSIEILQLPALDLREMIEQELSENETLEIQEDREESKDTALDEANKESHEDEEYEQIYEQLESMSEEASWDFSTRRRAPVSEDGKDRKLEALNNTASRPPGFSTGRSPCRNSCAATLGTRTARPSRRVRSWQNFPPPSRLQGPSRTMENQA